jgi:hypothetical protein
LSTDGQKIEVYMRLQKHAYPEQKYDTPQTALEARLHPGTRKCKRIQLQKTRRETSKRKETNTVEVITSAQESMLASWARIAARATQPQVMDFCFSPTSMEAFLLQASGKINLKSMNVILEK